MLSVEGVSKSYGDRAALTDVALEVEAGEILGLLGPNGAGKTTLVSIIAALRRPDRGRVLVDGIDVTTSPRAVHERLGLAPQDTGVYLPLSVRDNLKYFGGLAGMRGRALRVRIDELAPKLMLDELLDRRASDLSGGERRRLHTAIALIHHPRLVLLDEPTTGADIATRTALLELVRDVANEGTAVVYSTHYLPEIETLNANVAFLEHGRIIARGALAELLTQHGTTAVKFVFADRVTTLPTDDPARTIAMELSNVSGQLEGIEIVRPNLETVYLALTGREYGEAA